MLLLHVPTFNNIKKKIYMLLLHLPTFDNIKKEFICFCYIYLHLIILKREFICFCYIYLHLIILKREFVCCVRLFELVTQTVPRDLQQCQTDCTNCDLQFIAARTGLADAVLFGTVLRLMTSKLTLRRLMLYIYIWSTHS